MLKCLVVDREGRSLRSVTKGKGKLIPKVPMALQEDNFSRKSYVKPALSH